MLHIAFHFIVPALLVVIFFKKDWKRAYLIMMLTMLVDLDHLLANPIYDPQRCSINFHPLHGFIPIGIYAILSVVPKHPVIRYIGIGLLIHMGLDSLDCYHTNGVWFNKHLV